jgi:hypothetical protein
MSTDLKNSTYQGMYTLFQYKTTYHLDGEAFTPELTANIQDTCGLRKSAWLGDWWVHPDGNPELNWEAMIKLALNILHAEATRLFVSNLYLKTIPSYRYAPTVPNEAINLPVKSLSGAKRVNASCGVYYDYSSAIGISGLFNPNREEVFSNPPTKGTGNNFRLSGKDESCGVEGTWFDWCCFACNILSSENTKILCPMLFEPGLANDNY